MTQLQDMQFEANKIGNAVKRTFLFTPCSEIKRKEVTPTSIVILIEGGELSNVISDLNNSQTQFIGSIFDDTSNPEYKFIVRFLINTQRFITKVTIYCALPTNYESNLVWLTETEPMKALLIKLAAENGLIYNSSGLYNGITRIGETANAIYSGVNPIVPHTVAVEP